jgi:hypothetical protein
MFQELAGMALRAIFLSLCAAFAKRASTSARDGFYATTSKKARVRTARRVFPARPRVDEWRRRPSPSG